MGEEQAPVVPAGVGGGETGLFLASEILSHLSRANPTNPKMAREGTPHTRIRLSATVRVGKILEFNISPECYFTVVVCDALCASSRAQVIAM